MTERSRNAVRNFQCMDPGRAIVSKQAGSMKAVYAYVDDPTTFFDYKCRPVSAEHARMSGFDVTQPVGQPDHRWLSNLTNEQLDVLAAQVEAAKRNKE